MVRNSTQGFYAVRVFYDKTKTWAVLLLSQLVIPDIRKNKLSVSESDKSDFLAAKALKETTISNLRPTIVSDFDQISQDLAPKPKLSESILYQDLGGKPDQDPGLADI